MYFSAKSAYCAVLAVPVIFVHANVSVLGLKVNVPPSYFSPAKEPLVVALKYKLKFVFELLSWNNWAPTMGPTTVLPSCTLIAFVSVSILISPAAPVELSF